MRAWIAGLALLAPVSAVAATPAAPAAQPVDLVDPLIGTDGTGHTFPGPSVPFAMVQPGPDNAESGWAYTSGYQYQAPKIIGFSQNRASGTGIPELGDVLLQPSALRRDDLASGYAKAGEVARPGYYAVTLSDNGVRVELTSTVRATLHRYTFDHPGRVWVLVDLQHGLTFRTDHQPVLAIVNRFTRDGFAGHATRKNWTTREVAWAARFSRPIAAVVLLPPRPASADRPADQAPRALLGFDLAADRQLLVKVGLANTDEAGARLNQGEIAGWDFDAVAGAARADWNRLLARATIEAPLAQRRIFTTALYHAFLHPSVISDRDGRWRGPDGTIRRAASPRYSTFSLWDTMRAGWQLDTLLVPERIDDFVNSLLDHASASGRLPLWPIWGADTGTMIGEPALPVIADATAKGFRGFDRQRAFAAMMTTATHDAGLSQWSILDRYGYLPFDKVDGEAVSRTLELGTADAALARMAAAVGDRAAAARFAARAAAWRQLIDPETHLARGRDATGRWRTPFDPLTPTSPLNNPGDYTEANAWQYTWTPALHDPAGLVAALGGQKAAREQLDRFFFDLAPSVGREYLGQEAMIGQDAHGNEPGHHIPWLYAFTDRPDTGHGLVRRIARDFYHDTPGGIIGNDDAGQMSAWYVFATLGFYPVDTSSGSYVAGIPLTTRARVSVPGHAPLVIERHGEGDHLASLDLNGRAIAPTAIPHPALTQGGTLTFAAAASAPVADITAPDRGQFVDFPAVASRHLPAPVAPMHVVVWLPPGYDAADERYGVVYMHDGQNLFDPARSNFDKIWAADKSALRLIAAGKTPPFIIVGIDQPTNHRSRTYLPNALFQSVPPAAQTSLAAFAGGPILSDAYLAFIATELKPMIDARFRTRPDPAHTAIVGSSMGGLISLYAAARYPQVFGRAGGLSTHWPLGDPRTLGAVSDPAVANPDVVAAWRRFIARDLGPPRGRRLWLDHGTATLDALYPPYQAAIDADLVAAGWAPGRDFVSRSYPGAAHEENAWAARLDEVFAFLCGDGVAPPGSASRLR